MKKHEISVYLTKEMEPEYVISLVHEAIKFNSYILFQTKKLQLNAKSVLSMLGFSAFLEGHVVISAEGEDSLEAVKNLQDFLSPKCSKATSLA
ncbi:MAG: HPr family phosphocarrier protein [Bacillaceae bacterium]|jgi:phosphotransferase system HPr (HPr) family protein|uniref:HPr domain-containing protein n=2 Tax=Aeribacillus TaxID=1055323 RepID=A0A165YQ42_9BACI|nr:MULTISPECIES: HPr family phosphocarrier protein [Aeribacillus]AXI39369.1 HPr family phosphocarrier protein [Bacillaceae bacterium ZC4]REJ21109.1 MAG: HPr family phosphocarrier protein [Bacillaceae bacterium]ASS90507.1 hypothetical protein AP3564_10000 [Aeribacillus pallidus]KZM55934.1 hypothetical protein A3Q35_10670 [Aeribacillus pallidus]KZN97332.1 hypothetical protein AZI98_04090 [Aeribacillus pallidus]